MLFYQFLCKLILNVRKIYFLCIILFLSINFFCFLILLIFFTFNYFLFTFNYFFLASFCICIAIHYLWPLRNYIINIKFLWFGFFLNNLPFGYILFYVCNLNLLINRNLPCPIFRYISNNIIRLTQFLHLPY